MLIHMSYVYPYIFLTRQGNTLTIEAIMLFSRCGRVVYGARHKAKRLVLQCINGVSLNPPPPTTDTQTFLRKEHPTLVRANSSSQLVLGQVKLHIHSRSTTIFCLPLRVKH